MRFQLHVAAACLNAFCSIPRLPLVPIVYHATVNMPITAVSVHLCKHSMQVFEDVYNPGSKHTYPAMATIPFASQSSICGKGPKGNPDKSVADA